MCKYHSGFLKVKKSGEKTWTCCGEDGAEAEGCVEEKHKHAEWPDEEAKKYFYDKPLKPPIGCHQSGNPFEIYGRYCGVFRKVEDYVEKNPVEKDELSGDEQRKLDAMQRVCMHWGCNDAYTQDKNRSKSCSYHPGIWDFGHTPKNCQEAMSGPEFMWEAHWTCCRQEWEAEGCTKAPHKGPLMENYESVKRHYNWPDKRSMAYFFKSSSRLWREKVLIECDYDDDSLMRRYRRIAKDLSGGGPIDVSDLPELCDLLKLNLLANSEDMSYYFKFTDVVNETANGYLDNGNGQIDEEK